MGIPKRLLVHTCSYQAPTDYDREGKPTLSEAVELTNVRIEAILGTTRADVGETKDDKLTLYYDPNVSSPAITPQEQAVVTWQNKTYTVRSVTPHCTYGSDAVHHYEAALV